MVDTIIKSFDIWTNAQGVKSKGRVKSIDNISLEGIACLREVILELAIRGKLVLQDSNDEPANELLKKIIKEKKALLKNGKINKLNSVSCIDDEEKLFSLPNGWEFCRLSNLVNSLISGGTPNKSNPAFWDGDIPWASVKDLGASKYIFTTQDYITVEGLTAGSKLADIDDVIICTRMGLGKIAIAKVSLAINQDLKAVKLTSHLNVDYFLLFYRTLKIKGTGTTVSGIKQDELLNYVVPLPPLAEQKRIVAKVEELMALCDQLEAQQTNNLKTHQQLVKTMLETLTQAKDADEVQAAWQQLLPHFDTLFCTEDSIDRLKQTILQLAIMGRLVKQKSTDQPVFELLQITKKEVNKLVKEGKLRKPRSLPEIDKREYPFVLPNGWQFVRLNEIGEWGAGATPNRSNPIYYGGNIPWFKSGELNYDYIDTSEEYVTEVALNETSLRYNFVGDVLIAMYGATIGKTSILKVRATTNQAVCACTPFSCITNIYLLTLLKAYKTRFSDMGTGGAQPNISREKIINTVIPLPPLAEQKRIVAKLNELISFCDHLTEKIVTAKEIQNTLSKTIVENAVA